MKPCVKLCDLIRCHKLWPDFSGGGAARCSVMGMVPGHMDHCPEKLLHSYEEMIEVLADLEHRQWVKWSKSLANTETLSPERLQRWKKLWVSYNQLSEDEKDQDRVWARKVLARLLTEKMVDVKAITEEEIAELPFAERDHNV